MQRARRSLPALLVLAFAILGIGGVAPFAMPSTRPAAAVGWPASTDAARRGSVTGGASASDEFIEIVERRRRRDRSPERGARLRLRRRDIARRARSPGRPRGRSQPGQHLLVANATASSPQIADATWSSGIAATGGAVALRVIGGAVIDAVGWGDATNAFVEGASGAGARSLLEHRATTRRRRRQRDRHERATPRISSFSRHPVPQNLASPPDPPPASPSRSPSATPHADGLGGTDGSASAPPDAGCIGRATRRERDAHGDADLASRAAPSSATEPPVTATTGPVLTDPPTPSPTEPPSADPPTSTPVATTPPTPEATRSRRPTSRTRPPEPTPDRRRRRPPEPTAPPIESGAPTPAPVTPIAIARAADLDTVVTDRGRPDDRARRATTAAGARSSRTTARGIALYLDAPVTRTTPASHARPRHGHHR